MNSRLRPLLLGKQSQINSIEKEFSLEEQEHWAAVSSLREDEYSLILRIIKEEQLLELITWNVVTYNNKIKLMASSKDSKKLEPLSKLTEVNFSFKLEDKVTLRHDDGEVFITFDEQSRVAGFIQNWKLTVSVTDLDNDITEAKTVYETMLTLKDQL